MANRTLTPFPLLTVILPALSSEGLRLASRDEPCRQWRGPDGRVYFVATHATRALDARGEPATVGA